MNQPNTSLKKSKKQDSEINIESLISAPLVALSKANTLLLNGQLYALLDQYFTKVDAQDNNRATAALELYQPKLIHLVLTTFQQIGQERIKQEIVVEVPLLSIVPLNSIALKQAQLKFNLDITSSTSYLNPSNAIIERHAQLHGKVSTAKPSPVNQGKDHSKQQFLRLDIQMEALPLPLGILTLLDIYAKNIQPINT